MCRSGAASGAEGREGMKKPIHIIAHCLDCGIEFSCYRTGKLSAKRHSKQSGHTVTGEEAYRFKYIKGELKK